MSPVGCIIYIPKVKTKRDGRDDTTASRRCEEKFGQPSLKNNVVPVVGLEQEHRFFPKPTTPQLPLYYQRRTAS
jgi:hypothetical protein